MNVYTSMGISTGKVLKQLRRFAMVIMILAAVGSAAVFFAFYFDQPETWNAVQHVQNVQLDVANDLAMTGRRLEAYWADKQEFNAYAGERFKERIRNAGLEANKLWNEVLRQTKDFREGVR